uniref:Alpha/beta hydrolase fold-3 domain-containing protein n=1 Tax=Oryza punctata TaxID=4537 RepID=A0A0E0LLQ4_ORYPU
MYVCGGVGLAGKLTATMLSADYRLAPEHCLPAMHEDAEFLRAQGVAVSSSSSANPWLTMSADFERVFVCGNSCSGDIVRHLTIGCDSGKIVLHLAMMTWWWCALSSSLSPFTGRNEEKARHVGIFV